MKLLVRPLAALGRRSVGDRPGFGKDISRIVLRETMEMERASSAQHGISASIPEGQEPQVLPHRDPSLFIAKASRSMVADPIDNGEVRLSSTANDFFRRANAFVGRGGLTKSLVAAGPSSVGPPSRAYSTSLACSKKRRFLVPSTPRQSAQWAAAQGFGPSGPLGQEKTAGSSVVDSIGDKPTAVSFQPEENIPGAAPLALELDEHGIVVDPADFRDASLRALINPYISVPTPGRNHAFECKAGQDLKGEDYSSEHIVDTSGGMALKHVAKSVDTMMHPEHFQNLKEQDTEIRSIEQARTERAKNADATANDGSVVTKSTREVLEGKGRDPQQAASEFSG